MAYDLESKGSIVTEHFGKELAVIYSDGDSLMMTHFCNGGNQPRLKLKMDSNADRLEFDMVDITGLKDKSAPHIHKIKYQIVDRDHLVAEWIWIKSGKEDVERYSFTRVPEPQ